MPQPVDPNKPPQSHAPVPKTPPTGQGKGDFTSKPLDFLGMHFDSEEAKKLWSSVLNSFNSQIQKDKAKSIKAIKNFGKSPGDPDYEE